MPKLTLDEQRRQEMACWADASTREDERLFSPAEMEVSELRPCFEGGTGDCYAENRRFFHTILDGIWKDKHVLDYACGPGKWPVYFALTGARQVTGFDIDPTRIRIGQRRAKKQGVADKVRLIEADASDLPFSDDEFDLVIGTSALHHTIKYEYIFENLYRVMKPGTKAFFLENLADFPLWRLHWWLKGQVAEGDVPIFSKDVRAKAHMFSQIEIIGDTFVHSLRHLIFKRKSGSISVLRRGLLRLTYRTDQVLFSLVPKIRSWGSMSVIILTK